MRLPLVIVRQGFQKRRIGLLILSVAPFDRIDTQYITFQDQAQLVRLYSLYAG